VGAGRISVSTKRHDEFVAVRRITGLVVSGGGFVEVLPDPAVGRRQAGRGLPAEVHRARIVRVRHAVPNAEGRGESGEKLRVGAAHVVELRCLPGAQVRPSDRVVNIASTGPLMEHGAADEILPIQARKENVLQTPPSQSGDGRAHPRIRLLEAQDERIVGDAVRHKVLANPVKADQVARQHLRRRRALPPGRVLLAGNVEPEAALVHFYDPQMHGLKFGVRRGGRVRRLG